MTPAEQKLLDAQERTIAAADKLNALSQQLMAYTDKLKARHDRLRHLVLAAADRLTLAATLDEREAICTTDPIAKRLRTSNAAYLRGEAENLTLAAKEFKP